MVSSTKSFLCRGSILANVRAPFSLPPPLPPGTFVRIAPNHLSVSDPAALQTIYAHGNGSLKSNFYDAFVSITRGLFNTRDRVAHTRKRKIISHIFSQKSVLEFEPYVKDYVQALIQQWDRLCAGGAKGLSGDDGESGWKGRDGRVWLDCLPCAQKNIHVKFISVLTRCHRVQLSRL